MYDSRCLILRWQLEFYRLFPFATFLHNKHNAKILYFSGTKELNTCIHHVKSVLNYPLFSIREQTICDLLVTWHTKTANESPNKIVELLTNLLHIPKVMGSSLETDIFHYDFFQCVFSAPPGMYLICSLRRSRHITYISFPIQCSLIPITKVGLDGTVQMIMIAYTFL